MKLITKKNCCNTCSQITVFRIKIPEDLIRCIDIMKELIQSENFVTVSSNFKLDEPKTPDGYWKDDVMYYSIQCKECGRTYSCVCDTYHGNGKFTVK